MKRKISAKILVLAGALFAAGAAGMQEVSATVEQINSGSENILSAIVNVNEQIDRGNDITSEILKKSVKYMQDTKNGQEIMFLTRTLLCIII